MALAKLNWLAWFFSIRVARKAKNIVGFGTSNMYIESKACGSPFDLL